MLEGKAPICRIVLVLAISEYSNDRLQFRRNSIFRIRVFGAAALIIRELENVLNHRSIYGFMILDVIACDIIQDVKCAYGAPYSFLPLSGGQIAYLCNSLRELL